MKCFQCFAFVFAALVSLSGSRSLQGADTQEWQFEHATPTTNALHDVWAADADSVYVVGDGGQALHWDGRFWTDMPTPTNKALFAVHGSSEDNIWAVGGDSYQRTVQHQSVVLHYDGTEWQEIEPPHDSANQRITLVDVWVNSPSEVWVIPKSYFGLFRWDGKKWHQADFFTGLAGFSLEGGFNAVRWVEGLGLFVVGTHGQILRHDGERWHVEQKLEEGNFTTNILTCIFATDAEHVYAGHNWGTVFRRLPDGTWEDMEVSEGGFFGSGQILDIQGNGPNDLYFVTARDLRHFTGAKPLDIHGFGYEEVKGSWGGGDLAGHRMFLPSNDGGLYVFDTETQAISVLTFKRTSYFQGRLIGAAPLGERGLLLHGDGQSYSNPTALATYDGLFITPHPEDSLPLGATHGAKFSDVATRADGQIAVAFRDFATHGRGIRVTDGDGWKDLNGQYLIHDLQLDYSQSGTLYMADRQRVAHWPDQEAASEELLKLSLEESQDGYLTSLWVDQTDRIFVGARDGKIRHWNGSEWNTEITLEDAEIGPIVGDEDEVYAIAFDRESYRETGILWHRSRGGTWSSIEFAQGLTIRPFGLARGRDGIYFAHGTPGNRTGGARTFLVQLDGTEATAEVTGLTGDFDVLTANAAGDVFLIQSSGRVVSNRSLSSPRYHETVSLESAASWHLLEGSELSVSLASADLSWAHVVSQRAEDYQPAIPFDVERYQPMAPGWFAGYQWHHPSDAAAPQFHLRAPLPRADIPEDVAPSELAWLAYDGTVWHRLPAEWDETLEQLETTTLHPLSLAYWLPVQDLQPPSPSPTLTIEVTPDHQVSLRWPSTYQGTLYASPEMNAGTWQPVPKAPDLVAPHHRLLLPLEGRQRFFRLGE